MKAGRISLLLVVLIIVVTGIPGGIVVAQEYQDYWIKAYGGKMGDGFFDVDKFNDGSIVAVGCTYSFGSGKADALVVKFDPNGKILWAKSLGGENYDGLVAVAVFDDGSIVATGFYGATKIEGTAFGKYGDLWAVKFDAYGNILWQRSFGGPDTDIGWDVTTTPNGDILVVGYTESFGSPNLWVLRLDANGKLLWQRAYGWNNVKDVGLGVDIDTSGNIVIAGYLKDYAMGLVLKLNPYGVPIWTKVYDGKSNDYFVRVRTEANGDIVVVGGTKSFGQGGYDGLVMKLSSDGDVIWSKTYGGAYDDYLYRLSITSSGNLLVTGYSKSFVDSDGDGWILKLNGYGSVIWQKVFYGMKIDKLDGAIELHDAIYMVGWTKSFGEGYADTWLLRMPTDGNIECKVCKDSKGIVNTATFSVKAYDIPYSEGNPAIADTNSVIQDIKLRETAIFGTVGTLQISSIPSGADVYINGEYKGTTPLELKLPEGRYTISVVKNGYIKWEEDIELKGGRIEALSISLIPIQSQTITSMTTTTTQTSTTASSTSDNGAQIKTSTSTWIPEGTSSSVASTPITKETTEVITVTKTETASSMSICGPGVIVLMAVAALLPRKWQK